MTGSQFTSRRKRAVNGWPVRTSTATLRYLLVRPQVPTLSSRDLCCQQAGPDPFVGLRASEHPPPAPPCSRSLPHVQPTERATSFRPHVRTNRGAMRSTPSTNASYVSTQVGTFAS